jgi:DNA-binding response OmpR family regulator/MinD-like ATPase involved in chromosome partitioning or flagellar assembly
MPRTRRPRILLVEDDPGVRTLLTVVCREQGYEVVDTDSGQTALELAGMQKPDLVLLDWGLPDMTGIDVIRELRRSDLTMPIIMLTGRADEADVVTGLREGADEYLTKPVQRKALAARLAAHLRRVTRDEEASAPDDLKSILGLLRRVSIFFMERPSTLRMIAQKATRRSVRLGTEVLSQGAHNETLFVVDKGSFRVTVREADIAALGCADFFGATSALTGNSAAATVTAIENSTLLQITREDLLAVLESSASAMAEIQMVIEQRSRLLDVAPERRLEQGVRQAHLAAVYSPKGGTGKTTIALNLAAKLSQTQRGDVLLVDLSLPFNDAALLAKLAPSTCLARLADVERGFEELLQSALVVHPAGFMLLPTALTPEEADLLSPTLVNRALDVLRRQFNHIVFDLGVGLSETTLTVLEKSDIIIVLSTPELSTLKDIVQAYRVLHSVLGIPIARIHVVLNHPSPDGSIGTREIETVINARIKTEIRHDGRKAEQAALKGEILALIDPASSIARAAELLAGLLTAS